MENKKTCLRMDCGCNLYALYQGIPVGGYTKMIANLLDGIEIRLNTDYLENKAELDALADKVVYTGPIDAYFDYKLGTLEYTRIIELITGFILSICRCFS